MSEEKDKKRKPHRMTFGKACIWMLVTAVIGLLAGGALGYNYSRTLRERHNNASEGSAYRLSANGYTGSSDQALLGNPLVSGKVIEATTKAQNSVVVITTTIREEVQSIFGRSYTEEYSALGSGVFFEESEQNLYFLTNAHVIRGASEAYLYFDEDNIFPIYLVGESVANDLAVVYARKTDLKPEIMSRLTMAKFGDSDQLRKGDLAIAIGCPYSQSMAHTTTVGIVTGINQRLSIDDRVMDVIQTDASLNPGNSGGALINEDGEVIGINSAGIRDGVVESMGFAIAINHAKDVIRDIFENGSAKTASLGIESSTYVDDSSAILYRIPSGLFIYKVTDGGAADRAGIRSGDIIISINGVRLDDADKYDDIMAVLEPGQTVDVEVIRDRDDKHPIVISVVLDGVADSNTNLPTGR